VKVGERFGLQATQFELDFVDVDTDRDLPLFLDPFLMGALKNTWALSASQTLRHFFQTFVTLVREDEADAARTLFNYLHEPNETCLGLSRGKPRGNAIGDIDSEHLFSSIVQSRAVATGLVEDLEDFRLFIPGIDKDKVSDMTTNIIRRHLIQYTQNQCSLWNIPLQPNIPSGFYWDAPSRTWATAYTEMLIVDDRKILLTPKSIVSFSRKFTPRNYHSKFVLEYLQHEHLTMGSALLDYRKDGTPFITKKTLESQVAPYSKEFLTTFTEGHPAVFREFKEWVRQSATPTKNREIVDQDIRPVAQYLIARLRATAPGLEQATLYHRLVVGILELLLYPDVISPILEREIDDGRKRVDILFDNAASAGFFHRLHTTYRTPAQFIFVECKNYSKDVANPELDQLTGRFSFNRGQVGFLLCRSVDDMETLLFRCNDAYVAGRGIVIPLTDDDLVAMLDMVVGGGERAYERLFSERFRSVALR
jgi:hypothetical protein